MGRVDDNFEYSEEANKNARGFKFMDINYKLNKEKVERISTMHQYESMVWGTTQIGSLQVVHEKGYEFFRVVFPAHYDEQKVYEKLVEFAKPILALLKKEEGYRKELIEFFENFPNKKKWTFSVSPSEVGLSAWLPKYEPITGSYKTDIDFYKEVLHTVFVDEDGDILTPSFYVGTCAMRTQCRGWHLCCTHALNSAMKKYKGIKLTEGNALWWVSKTKEECL
jgi:hypothetical protein